MALSSDPGAQLARLTRRAERVVPEEELAERVREDRPLRVKLGVDPTARDVTLGWAVPLRKLRDFQDMGHTAVLIVGDFTARIGDPSGKSETRPQLSPEEVRANAEACVAQLLDILSEENLEVRYNSEWLEALDLSNVLRLTSLFTVAQMLERDDFSIRYRDQRPISLIEFLYPLMQAYDSVAVEADVELGGTDQLFNLLVGRDMQRAFGQRPQIALTMPLLEGLDGVQKMSQSLGNYIAIRDEPADMFGKAMSIPDNVVERYARLATELSPEECDEIERTVARGGPAAGLAKRKVAAAIVALYYGPDTAAVAEAAFDRQFKDQLAPDEIPESPIPPALVGHDGRVMVAHLLADLGLTGSRGEARRLLEQGGVRLDGAQLDEERVEADRLRGHLLQIGKRRFVRVV